MNIKTIVLASIAAAGTIASPVHAYTTVEAQFLNSLSVQLYDNGYGYMVENLPSNTFTNLGYATCNALDYGDSLETLLIRHASTDPDPRVRYDVNYVSSATMAWAIRSLCPHHNYQLDRVLDQ